jgi:hypothetical protein
VGQHSLCKLRQQFKQGDPLRFWIGLVPDFLPPLEKLDHVDSYSLGTQTEAIILFLKFDLRSEPAKRDAQSVSC